MGDAGEGKGGVSLDIVVVVVGWGSLLNRCRGRLAIVRIVDSGVLSVGSNWNMSSFKNLETINPSRVFDSDGLASLINIAVLSNPLSTSGCLLPEDSPVLLSIGRAKPTISSIESLLFEDLGSCWWREDWTVQLC